jgi:hypothetical protein
MTLLIGVKIFFNLNIAYFWFIVIAITAGYLLNKAIDEMIERKILAQALTDLKNFRKFYCNKIIWIDESALNNEYQKLIEKYPDLKNCG